MKVYVFTAHQAIDCEVLEHHVEVFSSKEDAVSTLKQWRDDCIEDDKNRGWDIADDSPDHYEAYEEGRYATNHAELTIEECKLQGVPAETQVTVEAKRNPLDDIVSITCYNTTEEMKRSDAIKFYAECMSCSDGCERDRYTNIFMQLMAGKMECYDDERL